MCEPLATSVVDLYGEDTGRAEGKEKAARAAGKDGSNPVGKEKELVPTR